MLKYQFPLKDPYKLGTRYGVAGKLWKCGWHSGLDFYSKSAGGDGRVYPIADGIIDKSSKGASYGNHVCVKHDDGYISLYAHLASPVTLPNGARVTTDTLLGIEGNTGNSTAPHLHIEIHKDRYSYPAKIDPLKFLQERIAEYEKAVKEASISMDNKPDSWAREALEWALNNKIISGDDKGDLKLHAGCTRQEMVVFLHRLFNLLKK